MKPIRAWHFVGKTLRDGSPVPRNGVWLQYKGELVICERGLHASREPYDALQYAPGDTLCLVECRGTVIEQDDKLACTERRIVERMDATDMLRWYSRMQALSVIHLYPNGTDDAVFDYLMTGDGADAAARSSYTAAYTAYTAAHSAAYSAAHPPPYSVTHSAARSTHSVTHWAAHSAARSAARSTDSAAYTAARSASRSAAHSEATYSAAAYSEATYSEATYSPAFTAAFRAAFTAADAVARTDFNALVHECFADYLFKKRKGTS